MIDPAHNIPYFAIVVARFNANRSLTNCRHHLVGGKRQADSLI